MLLEVIPLLALSLIAARHRPQFLALFGGGSDAPRWRIGWKREGTPLAYGSAVLARAALVGAHVEELARGLRSKGRAPWFSRTA
jgi:hypothetical protein